MGFGTEGQLRHGVVSPKRFQTNLSCFYGWWFYMTLMKLKQKKLPWMLTKTFRCITFSGQKLGNFSELSIFRHL